MILISMHTKSQRYITARNECDGSVNKKGIDNLNCIGSVDRYSNLIISNIFHVKRIQITVSEI